VYTGDANGSFSTDNSTFNQSNKTVNNGDTIYLRLPSAGTNSTARTATITIGSISDSMTVTTVAASDTTPDAFSFTDVTGADTLSIYSDTVTITGINTSVTATITTTDGAIFKVNNGTANTSSKTVVNNDTITVSIATTSDSFTLHQATITVGGVSDTFSVTTGSSGGFEP
jgi:ribosomal 50S subunit-recycling heat shock protein